MATTKRKNANGAKPTKKKAPAPRPTVTSLKKEVDSLTQIVDNLTSTMNHLVTLVSRNSNDHASAIRYIMQSVPLQEGDSDGAKTLWDKYLIITNKKLKEELEKKDQGTGGKV